jgi:uncharacterized iron-regulated membrane protein
MRRIILKVHLVAALAAGVFLAVLGLTGAIMAFEPELDHLLHRPLWHVAPEGATRTLAELGDAASKTQDGQRPTGFLLSTEPDLSYQILFRGRSVFVDQYRGTVLGERASGPDFLSRVHQLHLRLLIQNESDSGKTVAKWAAVAMVLLLSSGMYLWWPTKRVRVRSSRGTRRWWFDLHNTVGVWSFVFTATATVTGLAIGFDEHFVPWIYAATRSAPAVMYTRPPRFTIAPSGSPIGPDRAVAIARAALPGASPISLQIPPPNGVYAISARYPEDLTPGGRSRIYVDQYSGAVLAAEGSRTAPAGSRVITLNRALHTGDVFGMPSKIVMSIASLALVMQLISGVVMWVRKPDAGR